MNQGFRDWCIEQVMEQLKQLDSDSKQKFLRRLKFESDKVLQTISEGIHSWSMIYLVHSQEILHVDFKDDPKEILSALQEHFAAEMAAITE